MDDTRESTRSRSPIRRSSSSESPPRDASPVNFSAALDSEDKAKDKSMTDDEDEDGDQKKVSAAQYQLFRQAVTTSKGSFKVNPAKSRRASRASLLDLGDSEVTDRVSWLDQHSLKDTMASTARIAQGLKEDEEVETLNTSSSTFKHLTVKQIFPREPYRHRDAQYLPKPPGDSGFSDSKAPSSYQMSHRMCLDTEELARRSAIYASLADSMVASVLEELSPKDERRKLLREKLAIIQEAQVSAVSAGFAATSNLQLVEELRVPASGPVYRENGTVWGLPCARSRAQGPSEPCENHQTGEQDGWVVSHVRRKHRESKSSKKATSLRKTASRTSVFDHLGSPTATTTQRTVTQEPPFRAATGRGARHGPHPDSRKKPGKSSAASSTRQRWRAPGGGSPGRLCSALAESAGQLPGHQHCRGRGGHCIPAATSAHPSVHHFPDQKQPTRPSASRGCLAVKGAIERVTNVTSLRYYSRLFLVPKKTGDLWPVINLSTLNCHMVVPHLKMETQGSVRSAIRSQEWTVSIDIRDAYLHVPMHQAVRKYLRFVVNKQVYQFTCLPFGLATSPREFTKLLQPVVALLRQQGVKLHVYLRRLADQSRYSGTGQTARPDDHQGTPVSRMDHQLREVRPHPKSGLPVHRDAVQHSTIHSGAPAKDASQSAGHSSTLDDQSQHHSQRSAQASRHAGVHGFAGTTGKTRSSSGPVVGCHIMVPEDRELVRSDHSSTVGSVRGGLVGISSSPARSTPRHQGDGSDSLYECVQFGLGSPVRLTLNTGTVVSISKIVAHQRSGDAGRHQCCERLPASSEVRRGSTDVRQCSDCGLHQELGGDTIAHTNAVDVSPAHVVRSQGDYVGSRPSARSAQRPGGFPVQSRPDTECGVDDGHGASTTRVCQVGRAAGRLVCDIRQQTTHQVCIAVSGPQGRVDRCHVHAVGQWEGPPVRVPAIQDGPSSSAEVRRRSRPADSRRFDRRRGDRDSSLPAVKSTRVETLRAILRTKGHTREAACMMSRSPRESSLQVYESHWSRFVAFCRSKRWHVFRVRSHHFSTYMMHLFRDGLFPSRIISHRTPVASVLRHWVYDPAADSHIKLLVRAFRLDRPMQRRIMPTWDLHLVLLSLLRPPFASVGDVDGESSDDVIPLKWRTMKCVFLLALASARQYSYLHVLSAAPGRCVFARGNTHRQLMVSLLPEPGFLAKNQLPSQAPEWITVPGIAHLNPTEAEGMLCPVRQLKLYIWDSERMGGAVSGCFYIGIATSEILWGAT